MRGRVGCCLTIILVNGSVRKHTWATRPHKRKFDSAQPAGELTRHFAVVILPELHFACDAASLAWTRNRRAGRTAEACLPLGNLTRSGSFQTANDAVPGIRNLPEIESASLNFGKGGLAPM